MKRTTLRRVLGEGNSPFNIILLLLCLSICGMDREINAFVYGCLGELHKFLYQMQFQLYDLNT